VKRIAHHEPKHSNHNQSQDHKLVPHILIYRKPPFKTNRKFKTKDSINSAATDLTSNTQIGKGESPSLTYNKAKSNTKAKIRNNENKAATKLIESCIEETFIKLCNITSEAVNKNFLQIEKVDMEATLKSKEYLQRLLEPGSKNFLGDSEQKVSLSGYESAGIRIDQNFSFLSKVIPAFVYKHFGKLGFEEMKTFYYKHVLKYSMSDINEISFSMYNSIND
jgi:hypothetical protein